MIDKMPTATVGDRIIIEPIVVNMIAGLVVPESRSIHQRGKIILCGPDVKVAKSEQEAVFAKNAGVSISIDGKNYLIMRESDIFFVI